MNQRVAPQEDKPELKEHLSKAGIKVQERKSRRKGDARVNQIDSNVNVNGSSHPNMGSSYNGIFGY